LNNIDILETTIDNVTIINVYKPPNVKFEDPPVKLFNHPAVYIGDFNSHNNDWGYDQNDDNGLCSKNGLLYIIWNLSITLRIWELLGQPGGAKTTHQNLTLYQGIP